MTEGDENLFFEKDDKAATQQTIAQPASQKPLLRHALIACLFFLLAFAFGVFVAPMLGKPLAQEAKELPSVVEIENPRFAEIEARLKILEERPTSDAVGQPPVDAAELAALKGGLGQVTEALTKLEQGLARAAEKTDRVEVTAESGVASALAYVQLHTAAFSGRPFESERQVLRSTLQADPQGLDLLLKLEALAVSGVPTIEGLHNQFQPLALEAQTAIRKASAKTWQDRLIVALESLISIRKLGPMQDIEPLAISSVSLDLSKDKLQSVLDKVDAYPPEARDILKNWRENVALRLQMERAFDELLAHLIGRLKARPEGESVKEGQI